MDEIIVQGGVKTHMFLGHKELSKNISICGLESKGLVYFVLKNDLKYLQF